MVVYVDVLVFVNLIVDYFLLNVSSKILRITPKPLRIVLASLAGAVFSLYIFLPESSFLAEMLVRAVMDCTMVLVCFGFKNLKFFLKSSGLLFAVTCLYAGSMIAVWQIVRPRNMVINNSVVYFNISPVVLIFCTVCAYFLYLLFSRLFSSSSRCAEKCEITVYADSCKVSFTAIVDTGNSVTDVFGKSEILIVDKSVPVALFTDLDITRNEALKTRYRSVPCGTVSGGDVLDGFRCDSAEILCDGKTLYIEKPVLAVSKVKLCDGYSAILNPQILDKAGIVNEKTQKISV